MNLTVHVYTRPDFLDDDFNYESYVGITHLKNMFKKKEIITEETSFLLSFPERWLNILEQRALCERLEKYYPNSDVLIKTHSVYIIQTVPNSKIGIVDNEATQTIKEGDDELSTEMTNKLCPVSKGLVVNNKVVTDRKVEQ